MMEMKDCESEAARGGLADPTAVPSAYVITTNGCGREGGGVEAVAVVPYAGQAGQHNAAEGAAAPRCSCCRVLAVALQDVCSWWSSCLHLGTKTRPAQTYPEGTTATST